MVDYNGNRSTFSYDTLGRLIRAVRPDLSRTTWSYSDWGSVGNQKITIDTSQHLSTETYIDGFGRETVRKRPGQTLPSGLVKTVSVPNFDQVSVAATLYSYDPLGRRNSIVHPDRSQELFCYDGLVVAKVDANGHRHREERDIEGRVLRADDYEGTYTTCTTDLKTPLSAEY